MRSLKFIVVCAALAVTTGELTPGLPVGIGRPIIPGLLKPDELCKKHMSDPGAHMVKDESLVGDMICLVQLPCENSAGDISEIPDTPKDMVQCDDGRLCKNGRCESWMAVVD